MTGDKDIELIAAAVAAHDTAMQRIVAEVLALRILAEQTAVRLRNLERKGQRQ